MKRTILVFLSFILLCLFSVFVFTIDKGTTVFASYDRRTDLSDGIVVCANVYDINETGDNLKRAVQDTNCKMIESKSSVITSAVVENDSIMISGHVNGKDFLIEGPFCSISENKNIIVFNAKDRNNNFRVVFCSVEKDIAESSLYFKSSVETINKCNVVTKLYLVQEGNDNDFVMTEIYGNSFPTISEKAISNLPENHYLNLFWYAREFKPVGVSSSEEIAQNRAGSVSYGQLEVYRFNHLGVEIKHYMRYWQDCDIRDVTGNQTSSASATIRISEKWVDAPLENDCSSTYSTLSLCDVSIVYLTRSQTAVNQMQATGTVTQNGAIVSSFKYGIGVGLKGISATASLSFTWQPGNDNMNTGVYYALHTNTSANGYWREAEGKLKSSQYLNSIGNQYVINWIYSSYTQTTSTSDASLVFKYYVDNQLDYTQGHAETDIRTFSVNIT